MDATAARTFGTLKSGLDGRKIELGVKHMIGGTSQRSSLLISLGERIPTRLLMALYRLLDAACRRVNGLDATAARTFGTLCASLGAVGIEMIITHVPKKQMRKLMRSHGIILPDAELADGEKLPGSTAREFQTMEAGIQYCEEQFLQVWLWVLARGRNLRPHTCPS